MSSLFAYGSLMCEDIMRDVSGHSGRPVAATLKDHLRLCIAGEHYPAMVFHAGNKVKGMLYRDICESAWQQLDVFEGEMYRRIPVRVALTDGSMIEAQTYLIHPDHAHHLTDQEWEFDRFLAEGKSHFEREYLGYEGLSSD